MPRRVAQWLHLGENQRQEALLIESGIPTLPTQGNSYVVRPRVSGRSRSQVWIMLAALWFMGFGSVDWAGAQEAKKVDDPKATKEVAPTEEVQRSVTDDGATVMWVLSLPS